MGNMPETITKSHNPNKVQSCLIGLTDRFVPSNFIPSATIDVAHNCYIEYLNISPEGPRAKRNFCPRLVVDMDYIQLRVARARKCTMQLIFCLFLSLLVYAQSLHFCREHGGAAEFKIPKNHQKMDPRFSKFNNLSLKAYNKIWFDRILYFDT